MRKKFLWAAFILLGFVGVRLFLAPPVEAGIRDAKVHKKNKVIFAKLMDQYLAKHPSQEDLSLAIGEIGEKILKKGFSLSAYSYEIHPDTNELCFTTVPIWEGQEKIPLTFFLYIWPSKEEAMRQEKAVDNQYYASNIHSHPISCAFTVLQENITQYTYEKEGLHPLSPVILSEKKRFVVGEQEIDLDQNTFIHQMVYEGEAKRPAITLHAYGKPTEQSVKETFSKSREEHVYLHVLNPSGEIVSRSW